ncbi:STAS domain-containing protein [Anaerobaca lacustris]|uniref:STAS domain-containing protein n=1 Tax=Anaerobaca lacustris TaxID=3044600 RepID=A0AAW6U3G9_9BACT|nr:STAS domain-containing protein [Sedimentisphaerales bacterium M17dextr]
MSIQKWSDRMIFVELSAEPEASDELENLFRCVRDRRDCAVVVDLSKVTVLTSTSLAMLLRLKKLLDGWEQPLLLCSVGYTTQGIISAIGLDGLFEVVPNQFDAFARVQATPDVAMTGAPEAI